MRIGLNLLFLLPGETGGIQVHAVGLLRALAQLDERNEYFLFLNRESTGLALETPLRCRRVLCGVNARNRVARYLWEQFVLPAQAAALKLDLLHSFAYVGPIFARCASIVTTHDVNFLAWGREMAMARRIAMGSICGALAHRAEVVLTVSEFARSEIARRLKVPRRRIAVVPNAVSDEDLPGPAPVPAEPAPPYLLAFCAGDQNKNIPRLVQAFSRIAWAAPVDLVLVGRVPDFVRRTVGQVAPAVRERIRLTGFLERSTLLEILRRAEVFVFPSFYEGFGIPLLEAQALGVPVACARAASLPEVAADGAAYFDPSDADDMARVVLRILADAALRARLRDRGRANIRRFSWKLSAGRLIAIYRTIGGCDREEL